MYRVAKQRFQLAARLNQKQDEEANLNSDQAVQREVICHVFGNSAEVASATQYLPSLSKNPPGTKPHV
jgi:hypothetical protein